MTKDMVALTFDSARENWSQSTGLIKERIAIPSLNEGDRDSVIIKVHYAGFCGSDRGIWWRKAFGDMILDSLSKESATKRTVGHEFLGEIVACGGDVTRVSVGDMVAAESHIVCGTCLQCLNSEFHVCARDKIIGISHNGCFAEYLKLPAKCLWPTDLEKIRPEVAAIQEPFGNAVHACQQTDLRGKTVAVIGCGTIGLFAILIAKGMGAQRVIGIEVDAHHAELARRLGCDEVLMPDMSTSSEPWRASSDLIKRVKAATNGLGVDVAFEMVGVNSALNNAIQMTRRGGHVVLFGVRNGDVVIEDYHRLVMNGIQLHGVVGRRIFDTWEITRALLEDDSNGIQEAIYNVILNQGNGTIVSIEDWNKSDFEQTIASYPKPIIRFV
ncbi:MAG: zinc-binding dehydrogenase [Myxococcota bacterium]|nr:zinc-binding dehydrogenase [Myxococcota bacterium]MEC8382796.1 zinc-binding dehydrogenase [Myxococcota bacterium]